MSESDWIPLVSGEYRSRCGRVFVGPHYTGNGAWSVRNAVADRSTVYPDEASAKRAAQSLLAALATPPA
jgi:hypothetical protein